MVGSSNTSAHAPSAAPGAPASDVRAEFPPPQFWRRWCADAAPPSPVVDDAGAAAPDAPLPQVVPSATEGEAPYRVLIVEDDRSQAMFAEGVLRGTGMETLVVSVPSEAMTAMASFAPDLVLMDMHMPGMSGAELTALIREHPAHAWTPVVFLTGDIDPDHQFEARQVGADDVLSKPVRPRHLVAAVESRVRRSRLQQRQRSAEVRHPTTGLLTRTAMLQRLDAAIPGNDGSGALYFVEVESTAALRDRYGFAALEAALTEAGRQLGLIAGEHPIARLNDNSFLAFAAALAPEQLHDWARALRDGLGRHAFDINGDLLRLRALVGYAPLRNGYADAGSALAAAEPALREARSDATGIRAAVAAPAAPAVDDARLNDLHDAILYERFELAYQPIVAVAGGDDAQYQALLRLRDAEGRLQTAAELLPLAETAGIIHEVDRRVLALAVGAIAERGSKPPVRLFVSQSPRSLTRSGYAAGVLSLLSERGADASSLVIDVRLEDALIHAVALQEFCAAMVPAGVQLCVSQYRAGNDADALLAQLPLGFVRLTPAYSTQLGEPAMRDEMRAAIERAHRLGLLVVGQHVEDPQAAATLWMSGVDFIQGNLVQRAAGSLDFDFQHSVL